MAGADPGNSTYIRLEIEFNNAEINQPCFAINDLL
jgi:hypothetical protein